MGGSLTKRTSDQSQIFVGSIWWFSDSRSPAWEQVRSKPDFDSRISAWYIVLSKIARANGTIEMVQGNFQYNEAVVNNDFKERQQDAIKKLVGGYVLYGGKFTNEVEISLEDIDNIPNMRVWIDSMKELIRYIFQNAANPPQFNFVIDTLTLQY